MSVCILFTCFVTVNKVNIINSVLPLVPQQEVENEYLQEIANRNGYVMTACDWWGMSKYDVPVIVEMMAMDISDFVIIPDRLTQGMVNALLLMRLLKVNIIHTYILHIHHTFFTHTVTS